MSDADLQLWDGIRRAEPSEATILSALALRSKGSRGYSPDFLRACRPELTLSEEFIANNPVYVLEEPGRLVGFYGLQGGGNEIELVFLFVEPDVLGRGHGTRLWRHAVEMAKNTRALRLVIFSDPGARTFYERLGAMLIREDPSPIDPTRKLPVLWLYLRGARGG